jgi:hypothetical protein
LGHAHIIFITVVENRIIGCQIFCDLLNNSAFERIFNVMQLILVKLSGILRYSTVHVPYGILIETSPVCLPLDGWGARIRDLKGPSMNLFNLKED